MTTEERIWTFLKGQGLTDAGAAGLMGNLYAESGLSPTNLQNTYESKLRCTDDSYTAAVDNGTYRNFANDCAGYGLAQWTYCTRKAALLAFAQAEGKSIGDLEMQLGFLMQELSSGYKAVLTALKTATSVRAASDAVLLQYERPADQSEAAKAKRAGYGQAYYDKYAGSAASTKGETAMTEQELRNKVVSIMQGWIGCKESDGSHKKIIDIYNSHKPLACGYRVKYNDAWCATSVSAAAIVAGLTDIIPTECSCPRQIELFKKLGRWQENDAYIPSPGDIIYYDWQDGANYATTDNTGVADHVGVVESVSGNIITIIEGNYSDSIKRRTIYVNGRYIRGYGVPDYASKATSGDAASSGTSPSTASATTATVKPSPAATTERKATEAAKSLDKSLTGSYTVTAASGLHIRNGAGTGKASLAVLPKGTKVQCYGYYTLVDGVKWLYIQATHNGIKYTGFSSSQWLQKI